MKFLHDWGDTLALGLWGLAGATFTVLAYLAAGKPINRPEIYATLLAGATLAMTGSSLVGALLGIDISKAGGIGLCALITGMLGFKIASQILRIEIILPFGKKDGP